MWGRGQLVIVPINMSINRPTGKTADDVMVTGAGTFFSMIYWYKLNIFVEFLFIIPALANIALLK